MTDQLSPAPENVQRARQILADHPALDFHSHLGLWETKGLGGSGPLAGYIGDAAIEGHVQAMLAQNCKAASINLTSDIPILALGAPGNKSRDFAPGEGWAEYQRLLSVLESLLETVSMAIARSPGDVSRINAEGKLAVFLSTEGGHMVEDDPARIHQLASDGVTKFQPMHYAITKLGDNQTDEPVYGGLSPAGIEAVRQAHAAGMIIDAAHATFEATAGMAQATGGPVVVSHALMIYGAPDQAIGNARWLTREHAALIADSGGLVGSWCAPAPYGVGSEQAFVEAVIAMTDAIGIDHVCWSTDLIDIGPGPWFRDYARFAPICAALLEAGFSDADLVQFTSTNAMRMQGLGA